MQQFLSVVVLMGVILTLPYTGGTAEAATLLSDRAVARFLEQATWGPTVSAISQLQQAGIGNWLAAQFTLNTSDLPDQPRLNAMGNANNDLRPVQSAFFANAVTGDDQLRQRVAFALSEIWVVSAVAGVPDAYAYPPYWRIFRDNAFTTYRDIIKAVTLSPAMGRYLNMANNNKGNSAKGTAANENYARELLQLFTLGLTQLNPDGSPVLDSNKQPVPTYSQSMVTNLARSFTGWTYPAAPGATPKANNPAYYIGQMVAVEANHDTTEKTVFDGDTIPAGMTAEKELELVLDDLMNQPTMAPFVCRQLIEHLVTSNPSPAYIARVSKAFGSTGDMRATITAILIDPEARAGDVAGSDDPSFGHLREPVLFMANILRGLNATLGDSSAIYNQTASMGQTLFNAPSVFSYFSPQYRTTQGLYGPEFQIYSTQTAASRVNILNAVLYGSLDKSTKVNLAPFLNSGTTSDTLLAYINYVLCHDSMSDDLRQAAAAAMAAAVSPTQRVQAALYIVLSSGEYQVIH